MSAIREIDIQAYLDGIDLSESEHERVLIQACKAGNNKAFKELYRTHRNGVSWTISRILGSREDLEDILQEVFLEVHKSIPRFEGRSKISTWIRRLTINVTLQHIRKKHRSIYCNYSDKLEQTCCDKASNSPMASIEIGDRARAVEHALGALTVEKRAVLVMHDIQGLSGTEISEMLGKSILTIRTRLFYARRELYRKLLASPAFEGDIARDQLRSDRSSSRLREPCSTAAA